MNEQPPPPRGIDTSVETMRRASRPPHRKPWTPPRIERIPHPLEDVGNENKPNPPSDSLQTYANS